MNLLADALEARMRAGSDVVVVSSGAVGAGLAPLGLTHRPRDLATKQAAASVGQGLGACVGHVVRTIRAHCRTGVAHATTSPAALSTATRSAPSTDCGPLPRVAIVNENDTVATTELRFGDNDRLAALVAQLVGADAWWCCSRTSTASTTATPEKAAPH
ncbi:hypothetical protein GS498_16615 [Rhodococcus hoagii]|nr:hypothetical protein [Prescottella equi]